MTTINTEKLLKERFKKLDIAIESLEPGSKEYDLAIGNLCGIQSELTDLKKAKDTAEDNKLKREEQKRMNAEELKIKERQLEHEETRIVYDFESKKRQNRSNTFRDFINVIFAGIGEGAYAYRWNRVMNMEYQASDQTNVMPPSTIYRLLTERKPRNNHF